MREVDARSLPWYLLVCENLFFLISFSFFNTKFGRFVDFEKHFSEFRIFDLASLGLYQISDLYTFEIVLLTFLEQYTTVYFIFASIE